MKIFNEQFELSFTTAGGEITSFKKKAENIEYMWQGDATYWSGKNPTLFPIVGNTYDGTYEIDGKTYQLKNHGLIRYADLVCTEQSDTTITFMLRANEETKALYPFTFAYYITYQLAGNTVEIQYKIVNEGKVAMLFGFGLHPGFRCPLLPTETFEDYVLEFEQEETLQQLVCDPKKEQSPVSETVRMKQLNLDYALFETYSTLIYKNMKSSYVTLRGPKHAIRVQIEGYPLLALWTPKRGAPFLCIEPWYSHGDFEKVAVPFAQREGMISLQPNQTFETAYTISIE